MIKHCELCHGVARIYCEADDATLCWNCDLKVHAANFLVARHSRAVLCHACHSPTPWLASGADLGVAVTVCEACVVAGRNAGRVGEEIDSDSDEEGGGESQMPPWTASSSETPPPPASSSSGDEDEDESEVSSRKREVSSNPTDHQDHIECWSGKGRCCSESAIRARLLRESKASRDLGSSKRL